jgi:hypothetical protein
MKERKKERKKKEKYSSEVVLKGRITCAVCHGKSFIGVSRDLLECTVISSYSSAGTGEIYEMSLHMTIKREVFPRYKPVILEVQGHYFT